MTSNQQLIIVLRNSTDWTLRKIADETECSHDYVRQVMSMYQRGLIGEAIITPPLSEVSLSVSRWAPQILTLPSRINNNLQGLAA